MEIIEQKTLDSNEYIQVCPRCGSTLKWDNSDVQIDREGLYLECAVCGAYFVPDTSNPAPEE